MLKNKLFIFIVLIMALLSISVASAQDSSLLNVTDTQDSVVSTSDESNIELSTYESSISESDTIESTEDDSQVRGVNYDKVIKSDSEAKSFTDLQNEFSSLSDNSVVDLKYDYKYSGDTDTGFSTITISSSNVTINGNNHTIDAESYSNGQQIFNINGNNVTFKNITFINMKLTGGYGGGAIKSTGDNFTIVNSTFVNNSAYYGGAIYNSGSNFRIYNSRFVNNSAEDGGAIYNSGSNFIIYNSRFVNGNVSRGGAISNRNDEFEVYNCTFINNTAEIRGGAITTEDVHGVIIKDSLFINNTAKCRAAIDFKDGKDMLVDNCTFINNNATDLCGEDAYGVIGVEEVSDVTINNCSFLNNNGSAIIFAQSINPIVNNSKFINNTAIHEGEFTYDGSAIMNFLSNLVIANSTFTNNTALNGGAIYNILLEGMSGSISLINNNYSGVEDGKTYIYNEGTITSDVVVTVLGNQSVVTQNGETVQLFANITADGASVAGQNLYFLIGSDTYEATTLINGTYTHVLSVNFNNKDTRIVNAYYYGSYSFKTLVNTGALEFLRNASCVNVSVGNIDYGNDAVINVNVTQGATGFVTITLNNKSYILELNNSKASLNVAGLNASTYEVFVVYKGDENYYTNTTNTSFKVSQVLPKLSVEVLGDVSDGDKANVVIRLPKDATGSINVTVGNKTYYSVVDSIVIITTDNLDSGDYNITVNYTGDNNYIKNTIKGNFTVSKILDYTMNITDPNNIQVGESVVIKVNLPKDAEGTVIMDIDGKTQSTTTIKEGVAEFNFTDLSAGKHNIVAKYKDSDKYAPGIATSTIEVYKRSDYKVNISASSEIHVGDKAVINVTLPSDANGVVVIRVGNKTYEAVVTNGNATLILDDLTENTYTVNATYNGDGKYLSKNSEEVSIKVSKVSGYAMNITVPKDAKVGDNVTISVNLPNDATGKVNLTIGNTNYTTTVNNGVANFNVTFSTNGTYDVTAIYYGNNKYVENKTKTTILISKISDYSMNVITPGNLKVGETAVINVTLPKDIIGDVLISIDGGANQTASINDGVATIKVLNITSGQHNVTAYYNGDDKYMPNHANGSFNVASVDTVLDVKIANVKVGEAITINATLAGIDNVQLTGTVVVLINGESYEVEVTDGVGKLPDADVFDNAGTNSFIATWTGVGNYNSALTTGSFNVSKVSTYEMTVNTTNIKVGETAVINVTVPSDATGKVIITINGTDYVGTIDNGVATINVTGLTAGKHNITANYDGNNKYDSNQKNTTITVSKVADYVMDVNNPTELKVGETAIINVTLPSDANGDVTIKVGNQSYDTTAKSGIATITTDKLNEGNYTVTAYYKEDGKYLSKEAKGLNITVSKIDKVNITIDVPGDIEVDENVTIDVELPDDATGSVNITIDNKTSYNKTLVNGSTSFNITGLTNGTHNITIDYSGDDKYNPYKTNSTIDVSKVNDCSMEIIAPEDAIFGKNTTIKVTLPEDAFGEVIISVDGKNYTAKIEKGVASADVNVSYAGKHTITANYTGSDKYLTKKINGTFSAAKANANLTVKIANVKVGEAITILANLTGVNNAPLNGVVVVSINGKTYDVTVANGKGSLPGDAFDKEGTNTFIATWDGDDNYNLAHDNGLFNVSRISDYKMTVNTTDIEVGETAVINVTVPSDVTGKVIITINGTDYVGTIDNGVATINVTGLPVGKHAIVANYGGNNKYAPNQNNTIITVSKTSNYEMSVDNPTNLKVGDSAIITVTLPSDANGNVTIKVGNKTYNTTAKSGIATITTDKLSEGKYTVTAYYKEDGKYISKEANGLNITVSKVSDYNMNITPVENINLGDNVTIKVNVPTDATGNITITVDNTPYNATINNGVATIEVSNISAGKHNITANYGGDAKYLGKEVTGSFNVPKADANLTVKIANVKVGDSITILANLTGVNNTQLNGVVVVSINGKTYDVTVTNGKGSLPGDAFDKEGTNTFIATWNGDDNYNVAQDNGLFNVSMIPSYKMGINTTDIEVGETALINVTVPSDATGNVIISIEGKDYVGNISNGVATINVTGLTAGKHNITANYNGDNKYSSNKANTTITVSKVADYVMDVDNPTELKVGDSAFITVTLPSDANGNVTIKVGNKTYNTTAKSGIATITTDKLSEGNYTVTAYYKEDGKYLSKEAKGLNITVSKVTDYTMSIDPVENINLGDNVTIKVNVPTDATGNITITVDNAPYNATINNGVANVTIPNITAGKHNITANYGGDAKYAGKEVTGSFNVPKADAILNVEIANVKVGEAITILANLTCVNNAPLNGVVVVSINGKTYDVTVTNGKGSLADAEVFNTAGTNTFIAVWSGDDNYNLAQDNGLFNVSMIPSYEMTVNTTDIEVGETALINVTVPSDAKGRVIISIEGNDYVGTINNGTVTVKVPGLTAGKHNVTANYDGNNKYAPNQVNATITVSKVDNYNMTVFTPENVKVGDKANINVTLPFDANGNVTIKVGNKTYNTTAKNGVATITTDELEEGTFDVVAIYAGDDKYAPNTANSTLKVSKVADYNMTVDVPDEIVTGDEIKVVVGLPKDATGDVVITVNGNNYTGVIKNGTADIIISPLDVGNYNFTTTYGGDKKYAQSSSNGTFNVISKYVNLTASDVVMIYHDGSRLEAVLVDYKGNPIANATLFFTINGITYNKSTNSNGSASIALNLDHGTYNATILYNGSDLYDSVSVNATVRVNPSIIGDDLVKMWMNGTQFYADFLGKGSTPLANTNVTFNINGVFYNRSTNENGTAKLNINLDPGNYTLTAYNPINGEQRGFNVLVKPLIETKDLTKYYMNDSSFEVKVWNYDGTLAANKTVSFNINGVFYTRTADVNGIVKLAITLRPGDYIITSMYEGLSIGNKVKVLPTLETSDLSAKYGDDAQFKVRTLDGKGNPLANQNLTFNIHGVFYHKTTDANGVANLNINLNKGEYIITSYWEDYEIGNKITIS